MLAHRMYPINIFKWINEYINEWKVSLVQQKNILRLIFLTPRLSKFHFTSSPPVAEFYSFNWLCHLVTWMTCFKILKVFYFISWTVMFSFSSVMSFWTEDLDNFQCIFPWTALTRSGVILWMDFDAHYRFYLMEII